MSNHERKAIEQSRRGSSRRLTTNQKLALTAAGLSLALLACDVAASTAGAAGNHTPTPGTGTPDADPTLTPQELAQKQENAAINAWKDHSTQWHNSFTSRDGKQLTPAQVGQIIDYNKIGNDGWVHEVNPDKAWSVFIDSPVIFVNEFTHTVDFGVGNGGVIRVDYTKLGFHQGIYITNSPYGNGGADTQTTPLAELKALAADHQTVFLGLNTPAFYSQNDIPMNEASASIVNFVEGHPDANTSKYIATNPDAIAKLTPLNFPAEKLTIAAPRLYA